MAEEWVVVRVRKKTHAVLTEIGKKLYEHAINSCKARYDTSDRFGVSLDQTIYTLAMRDLAHRKRSNKKRPRRPQKAAGEQQGQ